jgi:Protein of unknown function (DUF3617)
LKLAFALLLISGAAQAAIEPGTWEFTLDSPLVGNANAPTVKQRCLTPEEAADPQKVLSEARGSDKCQLSNVRDSGSDYKFDVACTGRVPIHGSGTVQYTPTTLDGSVDLIGETQGLRLKTRSFVSGRKLGPCVPNGVTKDDK